MHLGPKHTITRAPTLAAIAAGVCAWHGIALAQDRPPTTQPAATTAASSSLLVKVQASPMYAATDVEPHALRRISMIAVAPAESRLYHEHDLIQIIVRESSAAKSTHELATETESNIKGAVNQWPDLQLSSLLDSFVRAGQTTTLPQVDLKFTREFEGEGEYRRRDDFTARLTAEVLQILPNGNLILESRTRMKQDNEEFILKVTGICRPEDVTPANTILSSQLYDLTVEKINDGELKKANEKGLFTQILDLLFAF